MKIGEIKETMSISNNRTEKSDRSIFQTLLCYASVELAMGLYLSNKWSLTTDLYDSRIIILSTSISSQ